MRVIVRPLTSSPMTRVSLFSHTSTLSLLCLLSLSLSLLSPTSYPFTLDTLIFQPKIKIMTRNFQDMILGVYTVHQGESKYTLCRVSKWAVCFPIQHIMTNILRPKSGIYMDFKRLRQLSNFSVIPFKFHIVKCLKNCLH